MKEREDEMERSWWEGFERGVYRGLGRVGVFFVAGFVGVENAYRTMVSLVVRPWRSRSFDRVEHARNADKGA